LDAPSGGPTRPAKTRGGGGGKKDPVQANHRGREQRKTLKSEKLIGYSYGREKGALGKNLGKRFCRGSVGKNLGRRRFASRNTRRFHSAGTEMFEKGSYFHYGWESIWGKGWSSLPKSQKA